MLQLQHRPAAHREISQACIEKRVPDSRTEIVNAQGLIAKNAKDVEIACTSLFQ